MSTATSVTPATLEASSGPRRGQSYPGPSRTQSTRNRPSATPSSPVRANSTYSRPSPSRIEGDYETVNIAQSAGRRSTDRPAVRVESSKSASGYHRNSSRSHHYQSSEVPGPSNSNHHNHHHHHQSSDIPGTTATIAQQHHYQPSEMSRTTAAPNNGPAPVVVPIESRHVGSSGKIGRSRTTIPAQSGNWVLGKTIGAGSMGEVKLARRVEGGEQVCEAKQHITEI